MRTRETSERAETEAWKMGGVWLRKAIEIVFIVGREDQAFDAED